MLCSGVIPFIRNSYHPTTPTINRRAHARPSNENRTHGRAEMGPESRCRRASVYGGRPDYLLSGIPNAALAEQLHPTTLFRQSLKSFETGNGTIMVDLLALKAANAKRWANAKITRGFAGIAKALVASKARYQAVEARTGVPWFVIAVIHERESSQNWGRSLAQGDPWNRVSVHVPAGRGPFVSWEAAAIDALVKCPPYAARNKDWSAGGALTLLEGYNGLGYFRRGIPSPYIWAGTDQYKFGKYVADGKFDAGYVDTQPGCAALIRSMMVLDATITFTGATLTLSGIPPVQKRAKPVVAKPLSISKPSKGLVGAFFASLVSSILKRKS